ncbi:MAG: SRPBCC family protein [Bacteroidota bacterium]
MKLLRALLWIVVILALVAGGLILLTDSEVTVTRTEEIDTPSEFVFAQVNDLKNWPSWMPWSANDETMKFEYPAQTAGVGGSYSWTSENSGNGTMKIVESTSNKSIGTSINFEGMGESKGAWTFDEKDGKTEVSWSMTSDAGYNPIGRFFNLMMDGMVGPDFEQGLEALKKVAAEKYAQYQAAEKKRMEEEAAKEEMAEEDA